MKNLIQSQDFRIPVEITEKNDFETVVEVEESGYLELDLEAWSDSNWREQGAESVVLRLFVDGEYNQDCVLYYGRNSFHYQKLLGTFDPGKYVIRLEYQEDLSSPEVYRAQIHSLSFSLKTLDDPLALVYRHTPVFYGRNVYHAYESRYTDTPLVLMYWLEESVKGTEIEYHMVFSHEDEGTPGPALMSKWGRTTDIEWSYRVLINPEGQIEEARFQGPHHQTLPFKGSYDLGGHPVLQVATTNGNVSDCVTSEYRFMLPPLFEWKINQEPREKVMEQFPFTYQVTGWEMQRQGDLESPVKPDSIGLADSRSYLFLQTGTFSMDPGTKAYVDLQVRLKDSEKWYSSSFHDFNIGSFRAAYDGPYPFYQTTIKWGEGKTRDEIAEIRAVWLPHGASRVKVETLHAFTLGEDYLPTQSIDSEVKGEVSKEKPVLTLWEREPAQQPVKER